MKMFILFISFCLICCKNSSDTIHKVPNPKTVHNTEEVSFTKPLLPYDLDSPSQTHILDSKLKEISSLAYDNKSNTFLTNDDESGHFYELDAMHFKITKDTRFSKKDDYEAIEKVGNHIIICKSNGTVYSYDLETNETTKYNTQLSTENNVEGMCLDKDKNLLLLACKGQPLDVNDGKNKSKAVYAFDLETKKLDINAYLTIANKDLLTLTELSYSSISKRQQKKLKNRAKDFAPSGIAIHPKTKDFYLISARGSTLVHVAKNKTILSIHFLNNKIIPQPEGISFDSESNLYITTEGHGYSAKIFKFNLIP